MFRYYHYRGHRNRKNSKNSDGADLLFGLGVPIPPAVCLFAIAGANIAGGVQVNKRMSENNGSRRTRNRRENNSCTEKVVNGERQSKKLSIGSSNQIYNKEYSSSKSKSTNNENNSLKNSKTKIHNKKNQAEEFRRMDLL